MLVWACVRYVLYLCSFMKVFCLSIGCVSLVREIKLHRSGLKEEFNGGLSFHIHSRTGAAKFTTFSK